MKKVFALLSLSFILFSSSFASTNIDFPKLYAKEIMMPVGTEGKQISLQELSTISAHDYEVLSGKDMNFFGRMAFKKMQKRIKKSINEEGVIENKKLEAYLQEYQAAGDGGKSQLTAVLLCFFLGGLGIHRFYLGYTWQGIVQLLTLGGLGIWSLIDFIRLLTGSLQPKNGEYAKTL